MGITTNIAIKGNYYGRFIQNGEGYKFVKLGRKVTLENIYEVIDGAQEDVYLKLSTDFLGKTKYAYILLGQFLEPKTIKALADIGFDVTTANFSAFVDSIRIQIEGFDTQGYAPTSAYEFLGWIHPPDEDEGALYYRASTLVGYPMDSRYTGSYDVEPRGSFDVWRDMIMTDVVPYPTLQLVLVAALASVVIGILSFATPIENPVVHLNLPSGKGKSTAGYLAASTTGRPFDGMLPVKDEDGRTIERHSVYQSWGATDNAMIASMAGNRGSVVVLNELGKSLTKNMTRVLFDLSEGSDKKRLTSTLEQRSSKGYATTFISTGESSLLEKCNTKLEGLAVRVMEITKPLTKDAAHANHIKDICFAHCGHAAPKLAQYILDQGGVEFVLPVYKCYIKDLRATFPPSPSKDRFVEKFAALFMTTIDIASDALDIPFDKQGLLDFMLEYDQEHGAERNTSASSYDVIIQACRTNAHKFYIRHDKSLPRARMVNEVASAPTQECWGRITNMAKEHTDGRMIVQEFEVRKEDLHTLLRTKDYSNRSTCIDAWKELGVLDYEDDTHACRSRKIDPSSAKGSSEDVYVLRVFANDEDAAEIRAEKKAEADKAAKQRLKLARRQQKLDVEVKGGGQSA